MTTRSHIGQLAGTLAMAIVTAGCAPGLGSSGTQRTSTAVPSASSSSRPTQCTNTYVLATWPVARRAAQLVVIPSLNFNITSLQETLNLGAGGVLFLGGAVPPANLASQISQVQTAKAAVVPPLVMADEEGGGIQRLAGAVSSFPWPRDIARTMSVAQTQALGASVASQMHQLNIGMDLAPVLDVDGSNGPNDVDADGYRSFSADPAVAAQYGVAFARGLLSGGVVPVVKHFPGLGGTYGNTDLGPASTPPLAALQTVGLVPFKAAIAAQLPAVMVSNAAVPGLTTLPASLSSEAITGLLRQQMGFSGLVLTDSLSAGAISKAGYDVPRAAVASIAAGADMILFGSTLNSAQTALLSPSNVLQTTQQIISAISTAVTAGTISQERLNSAVDHVLTAKGINLCAGR